VHPGRLPYASAVTLQETLLARRQLGGEDFLILLEHPAVITLGRRSRTEHLLVSPDELARRGIELAESGRGGDVTFHGPGQLVGYPIVDLNRFGRDLHAYLRRLEDVLLLTLSAFGVLGERIPGKTGVWVAGAKVASIGVGVRRWVSWHGFALNISTDLSGFTAIVPCGLPDVSMTTLERILGRAVSIEEVEDQIIASFSAVFHAVHIGDFAGEHDRSDTQQARLA
jgi:lipoyl(octanoyl) transferase